MQQPTTEGPSDVKDPLDNQVDRKLLVTIGKKLGRSWKNLGRLLDITDETIDIINVDYQQDETEKAQQMFIAWKRNADLTATYRALCQGLNLLERKDLDNSVKKFVVENYGPTSNIELEIRNKSHVAETREEIATCLRARYKVLTLKGPPCSPEDELLLSKYFIDMQYRWSDLTGISTNNKPLSEIFTQDDAGKRILLHGGAGSGKTATAAKLLYDWANLQSYINELFDLVVLISGRGSADTCEDILIKALDMPSLARDRVWDVITDPSTRLLLVLDDYDRITFNNGRQLMNVIRKEYLSKSTLLIMSRSERMSSSNSESRIISDSTWVGMNMAGFFHRQIEIVGITGNIQRIKEIPNLQNHFLSFGKRPKPIASMKKILFIWNDGILDFTIYPLHLYLLIVILARYTKDDVSLTEVHKKMLELLVRRYLQMEVSSSINAILNETHVQSSMVEFGKCVSEMVAQNKTSRKFNQRLVQNSNNKILELGFISRVHHEEMDRHIEYIPACRSILEFAVAYYIHYSVLGQADQRRNEDDITSSVRLLSDPFNSLCFTFLVGLAEEKVSFLVNSMKTHSVEYSHAFGLIQLSLTETPITECVMFSVLPFLSAEWRIPCVSSNDPVLIMRCRDFHDSDIHEALFRYAVSQAKIKILRWDTSYSANLPEMLKVEWLILHLRSTIAKQHRQTSKTINCDKLHCTLPEISAKSVSVIWKEFLELLTKSIKFKEISFEVRKVAHLWLPLIHEATKKGPLRTIRWVTCDAGEKTNNLDSVTKLLKEAPVKGLQLVVRNVTTENPDKNGESPYAKNMNSLIKAAACSKLNRLVIINNGQAFSINWNNLCRAKSWKWVQLTGVNIQCKNDSESCSTVKIKNLDLMPNEMVETTASKVIETIRPEVHSLICTSLFLRKFDSSLLKTRVTGLDIKIDDTLHNEDLGSLLSQFPNLQVLAVSLTKTRRDINSLSLESWLRGTNSCTSVKGVEIWGMEANTELAMKLVHLLNRCMRDTDTYTVSSKKRRMDTSETKLRLKYLMLNTGPIPGKDREMIGSLMQVATELKESMKEKFLSYLDIVCEETVIQSLFPTTPWVSPLLDAFPPAQGFIIKHDYWGMSQEDSFRSKEVFNSCPLEGNRLRITAGNVKYSC